MRRARVDSNVRGRTFALFLLVGFTAAAVATVASRGLAEQGLGDLARTNVLERSSATAKAIDLYLQARRGEIVLVSQLPDVIGYAQNLTDPDQRAAARAALATAASVAPAYESIAVLGLDGKIAAASIQTDEGTSVRFRDYFQAARTGEVFISDPSYSIITNRPALFFSAPVYNPSGLLVGVVRSRLNLNDVWSLVENDQDSVGAGARGVLVDDHGIRIGVSDTKNAREHAESLIYRPIGPIPLDTAKRLAADRRFGQRTAEQLVVDARPELQRAIASLGGALTAPYTSATAAGERIGSVSRLTMRPWTYAVEVPTRTYVGVLDGMWGGLAIAAVLALLMSALLTSILSGPGVAAGGPAGTRAVAPLLERVGPRAHDVGRNVGSQ